MNSEELSIRKRLRENFPDYSRACLKIRTKSGSVDALNLNTAQIYLHEQVEDQRSRTGKVRKLILKGRQQGVSTYIEGRLYWRVTHNHGQRAFILTHEQEATDNLFEMAQRYHENNNPLLKPVVGASNAKELNFSALDSGYKVGTAGTKGVGRSSTIQFFHGSEVAFWPHADTHASGVMQAVPDEMGTEIYLESTANGEGNFFHRMWLQAEAGQGDYEPVFIPWFWQSEYRRPADGIALDEDEDEYMSLYGLTLEQMAWRRAKVLELRGDVALFRQEYPATPQEAFQSPTAQTFIDPMLIVAARKTLVDDPVGPTVIGVDVARFGDDRTSICVRQGRKVVSIKWWEKRDTMETVGLVKKAIETHTPDKVFVDVVGIGAGVVDRLLEMGYEQVVGAGAGNKALGDEHYINRRAEMYGELRKWLLDKPCQLPDDEALQTDLAGVLYKYDSKGRYQLESKDDAKKRGARSPDLGDALALTFFEPVAPKSSTYTPPAYGRGGWMA